MRVIKNAVIRALKKSFFVLLILIFSLGFLPSLDSLSSASAQTTPLKETVKGVYDYIHKDFSNGSSVALPSLYNKESGTAMELVSSGQKIPENYIGDEISVTGDLAGNVLTFSPSDNNSIYSLSTEGASVSTASATSTGSNSIAVFYVNFVDHRERTMTYDQINDYVFRSYKDFLARSSNGLFTVTGNVYQLDLDINKTCEMYNLVGLDGDLVKYTKIKASQQGINVDSYDHKIVIIDKSLSCPHSGQAYRPAEFAYSVGLGSVAHELGHLYGLDHAGTYDCPGSFIENDCGFEEYWNYLDIMGGSTEHIDGDYGPYHKEKMGWLQQGSQVMNVSGNGTFTLERFEDLPGGLGPAYPAKVLKVQTYSGGPTYYLSHRRKQAREGVSIELASGSLSGYKKTALLDTTPGTDAGINDFFDGYLHDGQSVTDPFNGIVFEQLSHDTNNATVRISFVAPTANFSFMDVNFNRATGYLSAVGRKQDVSWSPVTYIVSLKCTSTFLGCPADLGDKLTTTNTDGSIQLANGFSYEYSVDIYTKKDGSPSQTARYFWYKANKNNVSCPGGAGTCNISVDWPAVTYKTSLVAAGTNNKVCSGASGCQDFIVIGAPATSVSFRGLMAIDGNTDLESIVEISDFGGGTHLLQRVNSLGKPDDYFNSCSSNSEMQCKIGNTAGIGPFVGNESILVSVKVGDQNGYIISGPANAKANTDGSYTRNWISWGGEKAWDYHVVVFPNNFGNCYAAGGECQIQSIYDSDGTNFKFTFAGLRNNADYRVIVCAMTCNPTSGNTKIVDTVKKSDVTSLGPKFFASDPFDQSIQFTAEYFDNIDFTSKKVVRGDTKIDFKWGSGSPDLQIAPDTFSVRWKQNVLFDTAVYRFITTADDGIRVYVNGSQTPIIDAWNGPILNQGVFQATAGVREVKVEYKENTGAATVRFGFVKAYECYDLNGDNTVNSIDQLILGQHFGAKGVTPWDLNGDKSVNSLDQLLMAKKFGKSCPYQ